MSLPIITRRDGTIYPNPQTGGLSSGDLFTTFQLYLPPSPVPNAGIMCQTAPRKRVFAPARHALAALWNSAGEIRISAFPSLDSPTPGLALAWNEGGRTSVSVFRSTGSGFAAAEHGLSREGGWHESIRWAVGDFNGDERADIAAVWSNWWLQRHHRAHVDRLGLHRGAVGDRRGCVARPDAMVCRPVPQKRQSAGASG